MNRELFAQRMKELREKDTLEEAAKKAGISKSAWGDYEKGNSTKIPNVDTVYRIAKAYNSSIDWLCGLTNHRSIHKIDENDYQKRAERILYFLADIIDEKEDMLYIVEPAKSIKPERNSALWLKGPLVSKNKSDCLIDFIKEYQDTSNHASVL